MEIGSQSMPYSWMGRPQFDTIPVPVERRHMIVGASILDDVADGKPVTIQDVLIHMQPVPVSVSNPMPKPIGTKSGTGFIKYFL